MTQFSNADRPDLDWSQVRETVKLLTVSVAQVENSMQHGDNSVDTLTGSFAIMAEQLLAINDAIQAMPEDSACKADALEHCHAATNTISSAVVAFQFYDRLQQCLSHVSQSLRGLSELVEDPSRLYNPMEWRKFQLEIRNRYTMESERIMFDAIVAGKSIDEAITLASSVARSEIVEEDDIELF